MDKETKFKQYQILVNYLREYSRYISTIMIKKTYTSQSL